MKVAFLVGSFITPYTGGSTSAYSIKERIKQTHITLRSIREKCPEAKIYFVEGSETDITDCNFDYDELVRPTKDFEAKKIIYSSLKSMGECVMMIYTANNTDIGEYDLVFKISGRYKLTDDFDLENFSKEKMSFYDHVQWGYETTLYSFPGKLKDVWVEGLRKALTYMSKNTLDSIEISLRKWINVKYVHGLERLGIEGNNAPHKKLIKY